METKWQMGPKQIRWSREKYEGRDFSVSELVQQQIKECGPLWLDHPLQILYDFIHKGKHLYRDAKKTLDVYCHWQHLPAALTVLKWLQGHKSGKVWARATSLELPPSEDPLRDLSAARAILAQLLRRKIHIQTMSYVKLPVVCKVVLTEQYPIWGHCI